MYCLLSFWPSFLKELRQKPGSHQDSNPEHIWLGLPVLCHWARCMTATPPPINSHNRSFICSNFSSDIFLNGKFGNPGSEATSDAWEQDFITLAFTMHSLLKSSVPKNLRNTKSLTNRVAMYSWVHAAVIRVVKYETLDISSSTGSQSTGYSFSCLWPFSAINKRTSHSLQFHACSTKWKY